MLLLMFSFSSVGCVNRDEFLLFSTYNILPYFYFICNRYFSSTENFHSVFFFFLFLKKTFFLLFWVRGFGFFLFRVFLIIFGARMERIGMKSKVLLVFCFEENVVYFIRNVSRFSFLCCLGTLGKGVFH